MSKNKFDIKNVAKLSRLELSDEEMTQLSGDLESIVEYINKLKEVDISTENVSAYLTEEQNVFRADEAKVDADEHARVIDNFPKKTGNALEVPAVFE